MSCTANYNQLGHRPYAAPTDATFFTLPSVSPFYQPIRAGGRPATPARPRPIPKEPFSKSPQTWGPHLWYYLHSAAYNYPEQPSAEQVNGMITWLQNLKWTIPCQKCAFHFDQYIHQQEPALAGICSSRAKLFAFFVEIHNKVNQRNGKPIYSVQDAARIWAQCGNSGLCV